MQPPRTALNCLHNHPLWKFSLIPPGYLISGILSADIPSTRISHIWNPVRRHFIHSDTSYPESCPSTFHPPRYLTSGILSADISIHPDTSHPAPVAGWERRTLPLLRADMSGYFDTACPDNIRANDSDSSDSLARSRCARNARLTCPRSPHLAPGVLNRQTSRLSLLSA